MRCLITILLLLAGAIFTQAQNALWELQSGTVNFLSDAPLEAIAAESTELRGLIAAEENIFAFAVNINTFEGFNSPLQRQHFNENYLESGRYPQTTFKGRIIERIDFTKDGTYTIRAKGILSVHGVEQERIIKSEIVIAHGEMTINSNFTVRLDDHDITIPRIVNQKIAEVIAIKVAGTFKIKAAP